MWLNCVIIVKLIEVVRYKVDNFTLAIIVYLHCSRKENSFSFLNLKNSTTVMTNQSIHSMKAVLAPFTRLSVRCSWHGMLGAANLGGEGVSASAFFLKEVKSRSRYTGLWLHKLTVSNPETEHRDSVVSTPSAFERSKVHISFWRPVILTEVFRGFCFLQENGRILSSVRSWPLHFTSFPIHYSLFILSFDAYNLRYWLNL